MAAIMADDPGLGNHPGSTGPEAHRSEMLDVSFSFDTARTGCPAPRKRERGKKFRDQPASTVSGYFAQPSDFPASWGASSALACDGQANFRLKSDRQISNMVVI